jgi:uncharacterized BrkB/YihY/UPF0761 family membrane protein
VVARRSRYKSLDLVLSVSESDVAIGGALLAGALAFRLFLWSLPAALVGYGVLGFEQRSALRSNVSIGLTSDTIEQAAMEAHRSRWYALIVGGVLLVGVSYTLARHVYIAVAITWREPVRRLRKPAKSVGLTLGVMLVAIGMGAVSDVVRAYDPGIGLTAMLILVLAWATLWWWVSSMLPHPPLPWWGLLPGAALVGIGLQIFHLIVVIYLGPKIGTASNLYGPLGAAATLLLGAYLIARLVLASVVLNAVMLARWLRDHPPIVETTIQPAPPDSEFRDDTD